MKPKTMRRTEYEKKSDEAMASKQEHKVRLTIVGFGTVDDEMLNPKTQQANMEESESPRRSQTRTLSKPPLSSEKDMEIMTTTARTSVQQQARTTPPTKQRPEKKGVAPTDVNNEDMTFHSKNNPPNEQEKVPPAGATKASNKSTTLSLGEKRKDARRKTSATISRKSNRHGSLRKGDKRGSKSSTRPHSTSCLRQDRLPTRHSMPKKSKSRETRVKTKPHNLYRSNRKQLERAAQKYNNVWFTFGTPPPLVLTSSDQTRENQGNPLRYWIVPCANDSMLSEEDDCSTLSNSLCESFSDEGSLGDERDHIEYSRSQDFDDLEYDEEDSVSEKSFVYNFDEWKPSPVQNQWGQESKSMQHNHERGMEGKFVERKQFEETIRHEHQETNETASTNDFYHGDRLKDFRQSHPPSDPPLPSGESYQRFAPQSASGSVQDKEESEDDKSIPSVQSSVDDAFQASPKGDDAPTTSSEHTQEIGWMSWFGLST